MPCSAHNLIKLHIADGLVRIPAGWSESCYILIREWFTQRRSGPRHRIGQASLLAQLFFHKNPLVFRGDRDSGIKLFGITSGETLIGTDLHSRKQRLRIRRLNACRLQLRWPHLIVEQSRRDEVFEIVVGLLFGLGMILRAIATTSREIERPWKTSKWTRLISAATRPLPRFRSSTGSSTGWP
jgi:hypothetical protein